MHIVFSHIILFLYIYNLYFASCPLRDKLTLSPVSPSAAINLPEKLCQFKYQIYAIEIRFDIYYNKGKTYQR